MVTLNGATYVPNLCVNLISLNKALKTGFKVRNDGTIFTLNFKHVKFIFDSVIDATDGCVTGVIMKVIIKKSTDLPKCQSAMKELMITIICTSYLGIVVKEHSTIRLNCMDIGLLEDLKHVNNVLLRRHNRKM
jgi:ABC-type enterobactin transport system permease subunit